MGSHFAQKRLNYWFFHQILDISLETCKQGILQCISRLLHHSRKLIGGSKMILSLGTAEMTHSHQAPPSVTRMPKDPRSEINKIIFKLSTFFSKWFTNSQKWHMRSLLLTRLQYWVGRPFKYYSCAINLLFL